MALSYTSLAGGGSVSNDFTLTTGSAGYTRCDLAQSFPSGTYIVTSVAADGPKRESGRLRLVEVDGELHVPSQTVDRTVVPVVPENSVLVNMWNEAMRLVASERFDVVLNFAYDAQPFLCAKDCAAPVAHLVSMGSLNDEMDRAVLSAVREAKQSVAMHSRAQADTFGDEKIGRAHV